MDNEEGWRRLAHAARARREELGWTQPDVYSHGGPSIDRVQAIEGARTDRYSTRTFAKLEHALGWKTGSCRAILAGGEPTLRDEPEPPKLPAAPTAREIQRLIDSADDNPAIYEGLMALLRLRDALDAARSEASPEKRNREAG